MNIPEVSEVDFSYIAGLIDGEGCFDVHRDLRSNSLMPRIRVEMCHEETIQWLQSKLLGVKIQKAERRKNLNHSTTYQWCVQGPKAVEVSRMIAPYLKGKCREAELLMQFPYGVTPGRGRRLDSAIKAKRENIFSILRSLKTKGKGRIKHDKI